jgi:hypothetical protein
VSGTKERVRIGKPGVITEVMRLKDGGAFDEILIRKLETDDRVFFEIVLIEALTSWPREDTHRLRATLVKHGYDEQCARRLMKEELADRVRAASLLELLRPLSPRGTTGSLSVLSIDRA